MLPSPVSPPLPPPSGMPSLVLICRSYVHILEPVCQIHLKLLGLSLQSQGINESIYWKTDIFSDLESPICLFTCLGPFQCPLIKFYKCFHIGLAYLLWFIPRSLIILIAILNAMSCICFQFFAGIEKSNWFVNIDIKSNNLVKFSYYF